MLGGNHFQITGIQAAKEQGYYVITVDYLPNNPGHKLADEYHNISTLDKHGVLKLAQSLKIDGIVSFASDVSAPTAAFVAEQMGLPTNPYSSVEILTHKNLFRNFLREHGFPTPIGATFTELKDAMNFMDEVQTTVMIKPVDSSGSKGVFKCQNREDIANNWEESLRYSIQKKIILEEFIERKGSQIDGDIFLDNKKIDFWGICNQHQDEDLAPYVPIGLSFPPSQASIIQLGAKKQLRKIFNLLNMTRGAFNIEYVVGKNNQIYILEIGPRNGGNWIPDIIKIATGYDMAANTVRQAVGDTLIANNQTRPIKPTSSYLIHSQYDGIFEEVCFSDHIRPFIVRTMMFVEKGSQVKRFTNAGNAIGVMLLTFDTIKELNETMEKINMHVKVKLRR